MGVCNCSMFCCMLLYVHSSITIILMGKRKLAALLNLSSWCLVMVERLFLMVPRGCLRFEIVVIPDHTHLLFLLSFWCLVTALPHSTMDWSAVVLPDHTHLLIDIMRQSACLVENPIVVYSYGLIFNCATVARPQTQ